MSKQQTGFFISIEGIEGVGKSTAVRYLETVMQDAKLDYILTREPGGTPIAEAIRQCLLHDHNEAMQAETELLLMFASRAQHTKALIKPALAEGRVVISDRFTDASFAYQGGGRGIDRAAIDFLEHFVQQGLQPDLTFLLDAPVDLTVERLSERKGLDRIEVEQRDFFERTRAAYLQRAEAAPERFVIIDATHDLENVQQQLFSVLQARLLR